MNDEDVTVVTILLQTELLPDDLMERIEHAVCPDADDPDHRCALLVMGMRPFLKEALHG